MLGKIKFLLIYFFSWVLFFEIARGVFILYHFDKINQLSVASIIATFIYGLRMDLSMTAYIILPVCLSILLSSFFEFFRKIHFYKYYTAILLLLLLLVIGADLELYNQWGFRIDATPIKYLNTPKEVWATISHLPLFFITIIFIVVYLLLCFLFFKLLRRIIQFLQEPFHRLYSSLAVLTFMALMVIPMRGGFQLAPMNQSSVYFSKNNFANHVAINASWNFVHGLKNFKESNKNPYVFVEPGAAKKIVDHLHDSQGEIISLVNNQHTNVILIIWESFTSKALHHFQGKEVTPFFNELKREGIFFSNMYASGDRTDKGLSAVLSGYPALPATSIIRYPAKSAKLSFLPQLFLNKGYTSSFYYGGETEFANIKSYLLQAGFDPIVDKNAFSLKDRNSKWGAHDGVVANKIINDLETLKQPFFTTWLTLSSHEPFEIPEAPLFAGNDNTSKFLSSIHYTDKVIFDFIQQCKKQTWWQNSVVVIIGDHGHPLPETGKRIDNFKIPMLWLGGALKEKNITIDHYSTQTDFASTISTQFDLTTQGFIFSKDILNKSALQWGMFHFKDGFGFIKPDRYYIFDNIGKQIIEKGGEVTAQDLKEGQALQQIMFEDFLKR